MTEQNSESAAGGLRHTTLYSRHSSLGAKLADFGGWEMPIEYPSGGVLKEHAAVRERVGLFDVGHLGKLSVTGPGAAEFVNSCLTNDLNRIEPGQSQYSLCCDAEGGVVDDLIVYLRGADDVFLIPNAANSGTVAELLRAAAPAGIEIVDQHEEYGVLAVQGPLSDQVLASLGLPTAHQYMSFETATLGGAELLTCRTGYTGERGCELLPRAEDAERVWDLVLEAVLAAGGLPCGLGARDTLRTELGYPLHGHELNPGNSALEAAVSWAIGWDKPTFWGREALAEQRAERAATGGGRILRGLLALDRGVPRAEMTVLDEAGVEIGETTSGTFSPTLQQGVALALIDRRVPLGAEVEVQVRNRRLRCRVQKVPFVPAHTHAG